MVLGLLLLLLVCVLVNDVITLVVGTSVSEMVLDVMVLATADNINKNTTHIQTTEIAKLTFHSFATTEVYKYSDVNIGYYTVFRKKHPLTFSFISP